MEAAGLLLERAETDKKARHRSGRTLPHVAVRSIAVPEKNRLEIREASGISHSCVECIGLRPSFPQRTQLYKLVSLPGDGPEPMIPVLVRYPDIDVFATDDKGAIALDYARYYQFSDITQLLEEATGL